MNVLSMENCGICFRVKTILKNKGVPYKELTLDSEEGSALSKRAPVKEMPIIELNNGTIYCGKQALLYVKGL